MLKTVRALDNVYGDRNLSCIIDHNMYTNVASGQRVVYSAQSDAFEECIQEVANYLGSNEWQFLYQTYYTNAGGYLTFYDVIIEKFKRAFRGSRIGHFNALTPDVSSGEISINDVDTGFYDYSVLRSGFAQYAAATINLSSFPSTPFTVNCYISSTSTDTDQLCNMTLEFYVCDDDILNSSGKWDIKNDTKIRRIGVTFFIRIYNNELLPTYGTIKSVEADVTGYDVGLINSICATALNNTEPDPETPETDPFIDPNNNLDPSNEDGGQGSDGAINWNIDASDVTPVPNLPSLSVADTGFITLYNPSATQLKNLANYMWGNLFDVSTWKKVLADPMDAIIGLSLVPVNVPSGGSQVVTVGNISTGISLTKASTQFVEVDCGSVKIDEIWKAYLDYSPYTKISIYLPYIGSQELDIDLYQNSTVGVKYHIDILSGACVAYITVNGNVICQFSGQCAVSIPITSQDFTQTITALATLVASGVGVVATGGMSAPVQGAAIAGMTTAAANTAANVISSKPIYAKTGNMAGSNGLMGVQTPYLIIEHARQCAPAYQNRFTGYPSYITKLLSSISGFTQIQDIRLENIGCTSEERNEILQLLRSGVIL